MEDEPEFPDLARNVTALMKAKSIGIGALATELKIGNGSVQKMRAGKGNVELGSVGKVARRLGKTAAELVKLHIFDTTEL